MASAILEFKARRNFKIFVSCLWFSLPSLAAAQDVSVYNLKSLQDKDAATVLCQEVPEIPCAASKEFLSVFKNLVDESPSIASELEAVFLASTTKEREFVLRIFASSYTTPEAETAKKSRILWKLSVDLVDKEENISYSLSHNGEMREGDSFEIIDALDTLFKKFPSTRTAIKNDDLVRIQSKYTALNDIYKRISAEADAKSAEADAKSAEADAKSAEAKAQSAELDAHIAEVEAQIAFMESLIQAVSN